MFSLRHLLLPLPRILLHPAPRLTAFRACHQELHKPPKAKVKVAATPPLVNATDSNINEETLSPPEDTFGTLSSDLVQQHEQERESFDGDDHDGETEFRAKIADTGRPRPVDYLRQMNDLVRRRDLKAALTLLDVDMKREYVRPGEKHYRVLIHACGKEGYTQKAFDLYRDYTARRLDWNHGIYADLFNSCANNTVCPDFALEKARGLRQKLADKGIQLPAVVYHNMLKAFGRCGDLETAFSLVDEMLEQKLPVDVDTYVHLLHGCISDKKAGFRHAMLVWRSMMSKNKNRVVPTVTAYNLLLRAAKECEAGDDDFTHDLVLACMSVKQARRHHLMLADGAPKETREQQQQHLGSTGQVTSTGLRIVMQGGGGKDLAIADSSPVLPNLLMPAPNFDGVVSIGSLKRPQDRFLLLGGMGGFCNVLSGQNIQPDAKAFTYMLDLIEDSAEEETALLRMMEKTGVTPDTIFLNLLIRRRAFRRDHEAGRRTLELFNIHGIKPDIVTFGCLALCCVSRQDSVQLLADMEVQGFRPNIEIMATLIMKAAKRNSVQLVLHLLKVLDRMQIEPNRYLLNTLETFRKTFRGHVLNAERGNLEKVPKIVRHEMNNEFKGWQEFCSFYADWLKRSRVSIPEHPWKQFHTPKDAEQIKVRPVLKALYEEHKEIKY